MRTTTRIVNHIAVISLRGRFDFHASHEFKQACAAALQANEVREVEIDLGEIQFLDSSALGMLLMLREEADSARKRATLSNCRGTVKQVLDIANFAKLFQIK